MKEVFVFFLATVIISVTLADLKLIKDIQEEQNDFEISPSRIIRGTRAVNGQFPYQIHLTIRNLTSIVGYCGGSIIAEQWVLTAAHCTADKFPILDIVVDFPKFDIKAGSVNVNSPEQTKHVVFFGIFTHPDYDPDTLMNDISLLRTPTPFKFNKNVGAILLAPADFNPEDNVGEQVTASGFGYITNTGPKSTVLLYTTNLRIISKEQCQSQYIVTLPTTIFCVEDKTTPISAICSGDSGGPLVLVIAGKTRQIGIVSFGVSTGCDKAGQGFTNVAQYIPWINEITGL